MKLFFFFYFGCKTELVEQMISLKKKIVHEVFVHLIYKIKHEEELLKDILLLGKSLDLLKPFAFRLHNWGKWEKIFLFMTLERANTHKKLDHSLILQLV